MTLLAAVVALDLVSMTAFKAQRKHVAVWDGCARRHLPELLAPALLLQDLFQLLPFQLLASSQDRLGAFAEPLES